MSSLADSDTPYYNSIRTSTSFKIIQHSDVNALLYGNPSRAGGHYIDVGNMQNILDGKVKVKSDARIKGFVEKGLEFEDGEVVEADVVVYATGFRNDVREMTERLCGREVAEKVEGYWGVDTEGEIRGAWKPTGRESRFHFNFSLFPPSHFRFLAFSVVVFRISVWVQ